MEKKYCRKPTVNSGSVEAPHSGVKTTSVVKRETYTVGEEKTGRSPAYSLLS